MFNWAVVMAGSRLSETEDPGSKSSHQLILLGICLVLTVKVEKTTNNEKDAGIGALKIKICSPVQKMTNKEKDAGIGRLKIKICSPVQKITNKEKYAGIGPLKIKICPPAWRS